MLNLLYFHHFIIVRKWFTKEESKEHSITLRGVPLERKSFKSFLGDFRYTKFPLEEGKPVSQQLEGLVEECRRIIPQQTFNWSWVQRYMKGQNVSWHLDPANTVGGTLVCVFGDFKGGIVNVEGQRAHVRPGDVYFLRCKLFKEGLLAERKKMEMPWHCVSKIEEGERLVLMFSELT